MAQHYLKISVVTPTLNRVGFVRKAVESVLAQDYPNFEHIWIDGASTDGTLEALAQYPHLRFVSEPDEGAIYAVNKGLQLVEGDVIVAHNSDDYYLPGAFHAVNRYLQQNPQWGFVCGRACWVDSRGWLIYQARSLPARNLLELRLGLRGFVTPGLFVRKEIVSTVGLFNTKYRLAADFDWFIRIAQRCQWGSVPDYLVAVTRHPDSGIIKYTDLHQQEVEEIISRYASDHPVERYILLPATSAFRKVWRVLQRRRWSQI